MPAYLVHGVPDTSRLWHAVRARLERSDVVTPDLPGFGVPIPDGFGATADEYADWLVADIARLGTPVDLVGHDWGAMLAQRVTSLRPDLVRSLACGAGWIDLENEWHPTAVAWQTPGVGEQMMELFGGDMAREGLVAAGVPADDARETVSRVDARMKDCILKLYRSAVDVRVRWSPALDQVRVPTLAIGAADDPFADGAYFGKRLAARVGGTLLEVDGGHWWPLVHPVKVAAALTEHWRGV